MLGSKIIIVCGTLAIGLMCLYPPYTSTGVTVEEEILLEESRYCVFTPPEDQTFNTGRSAYSIVHSLDGYQLSGQIIFVSVITLTLAGILYSIQQIKDQRSTPGHYARLCKASPSE